jgi:hypothetical protein
MTEFVLDYLEKKMEDACIPIGRGGDDWRVILELVGKTGRFSFCRRAEKVFFESIEKKKFTPLPTFDAQDVLSSLLSGAAECGHTKLCEKLTAAHKCPPDCMLSGASMGESVETCKRAIELGAAPSYVCLWLAGSHGSYEEFKLLFEKMSAKISEGEKLKESERKLHDTDTPYDMYDMRDFIEGPIASGPDAIEKIELITSSGRPLPRYDAILRTAAGRGNVELCRWAKERIPLEDVIDFPMNDSRDCWPRNGRHQTISLRNNFQDAFCRNVEEKDICRINAAAWKCAFHHPPLDDTTTLNRVAREIVNAAAAAADAASRTKDDDSVSGYDDKRSEEEKEKDKEKDKEELRKWIEKGRTEEEQALEEAQRDPLLVLCHLLDKYGILRYSVLLKLAIEEGRKEEVNRLIKWGRYFLVPSCAMYGSDEVFNRLCSITEFRRQWKLSSYGVDLEPSTGFRESILGRRYDEKLSDPYLLEPESFARRCEDIFGKRRMETGGFSLSDLEEFVNIAVTLRAQSTSTVSSA